MTIELRQLRYAVLAADTHSFARAAPALPERDVRIIIADQP